MMNMKSFLVACTIFSCWEDLFVFAFVVSPPRHIIRSIKQQQLYMVVGNAAVFSGGREEEYDSQTQIPTKIKYQQKYATMAQRLRKEATEMEIALREETLANNVHVPIALEISTAVVLKQQQTTTAVSGGTLPVADLRSKMSYLSIGDAVRVSYELDRLKSKGRPPTELLSYVTLLNLTCCSYHSHSYCISLLPPLNIGDLRLWKSIELEQRPDFMVSDAQLTALTSIEPKDLSLDDVGFSDQKVLAAAMVMFAGFGMGSASIGGE